jgi:glycosyltransferase involved in cell wall biosynthesis
LNLRRGLDLLDVPYLVNLPFNELKPEDRVGVLGRGRYSLREYDRPNPVLAGIGLMTHPSEWPTLLDDYPVALYLQPSEWANRVYVPFFGNKCRIWPVGIDTGRWRPTAANRKRFDFVIYDKILWNRDCVIPALIDPIRNELTRRGLSFAEVRYGSYGEERYDEVLQQCRFMLFLCEHESQGIAYQECLSSGVPILAWDQGWYLDPNRSGWCQSNIPATSVPYFDARCGLTFQNIDEFAEKLTVFCDLHSSGTFAPRDYVVEHLSLEKSAADFLALLEEAHSGKAEHSPEGAKALP